MRLQATARARSREAARPAARFWASPWGFAATRSRTSATASGVDGKAAPGLLEHAAGRLPLTTPGSRGSASPPNSTRAKSRRAAAAMRSGLLLALLGAALALAEAFAPARVSGLRPRRAGLCMQGSPAQPQVRRPRPARGSQLVFGSEQRAQRCP